MAFGEDAGKNAVKEAEQNLVPELEQKGQQLIDYAANVLKALLTGKRVVISIEDKPA